MLCVTDVQCLLEGLLKDTQLRIIGRPPAREMFPRLNMPGSSQRQNTRKRGSGP
jgi:hypothetical protein